MIHLKELQNEKRGAKEREDGKESFCCLPPAGSLLRWPQLPGLGQAEARSFI